MTPIRFPTFAGILILLVAWAGLMLILWSLFVSAVDRIGSILQGAHKEQAAHAIMCPNGTEYLAKMDACVFVVRPWK